jgi:uncharacterized tellurite resistance protein B-like protein
MAQAILRWLAGERAPDPPIALEGFTPNVPVEEVPEAAPPPPELTSDPQELRGRAFIIEYEDAQGYQSERRIIALVCYRSGERSYLQSRCLEAGAPRAFRLDRIRAIYCGVTGEHLGPVDALLRPTEERPVRVPPNQIPRPASRYPEMKKVLGLLITLARADGVVHPNEETVLRGVVEQTLPEDVPQADVDDLIRWAWERGPSFDLFDAGVRFAFEDQPRWALTLMEAADDITRADGRVCAAEAQWLGMLERIGRAYGVS